MKRIASLRYYSDGKNQGMLFDSGVVHWHTVQLLDGVRVTEWWDRKRLIERYNDFEEQYTDKP